MPESSIRDGVCPKCGSREVYANLTLANKRGANDSNTIPVNMLQSVALDHFICTNCGYVETYLTDPIDRRKIADSWNHVHPRQPMDVPQFGDDADG